MAAPSGSCSCWRAAASRRSRRTSVAEARAEIRRLPARDGRPRRADRRDRRSHDRRARPAGCASASTARPAAVARLLPTILYFHGGGWMIGSLEGLRPACAATSAPAPAARWSPSTIDWRPSTSFPAAIDDAVAAYRWLASRGDRPGHRPGAHRRRGRFGRRQYRRRRGPAAARRGAAALPAVADLSRDRPRLRQPLLHELRRGLPADPRRHGMVPRPLSQRCRAKSTTRAPRRCAADDLAGLPPALVYTAGFDPLRDEGQAYADRLAAAGVKTIHREFDSLIHGFVGMRGALQAAARAMDDMVAGLRHELAQLGTTEHGRRSRKSRRSNASGRAGASRTRRRTARRS